MSLKMTQTNAGIRTLECACGWEAAFAIPEEFDLMLTAIFEHLRYKHEVFLPQFWFMDH